MKQSLGRGLEALIPTNRASSSGLMEVDLTSIEPNDEQPRKVFDGEALKSLAESISEKGVIQPVILTRIADNRFMLIEGERRWRAAGLAGKKTIPAVVRNAETPKERLELALVANAQREDLNVIELAQAYSSLIDEYSYTQEEVSAIVGHSRSLVANRLRLLTLPKVIIDALIDKTISEGHARALLGIDDTNKMLPIFAEVVQKQLSVRQTECLVKRGGLEHLTPPVRLREAPHVADIRGEMEQFFNLKVNIKGKRKGGVIEIKYNSDDELDTVIKKIRGEVC